MFVKILSLLKKINFLTYLERFNKKNWCQMSVKLIEVFLDTINLQCKHWISINLLIAKNRSNFAFSDSIFHNQYCHDNFKYIYYFPFFFIHTYCNHYIEIQNTFKKIQIKTQTKPGDKTNKMLLLKPLRKKTVYTRWILCLWGHSMST